MRNGINRIVYILLIIVLCIVSFFGGIFFQKSRYANNEKVDIKATALFDRISIDDVKFEDDGVLLKINYTVNSGCKHLIQLDVINTKCEAQITGKVYIDDLYLEYDLLPLNDKTTFDASYPKDFEIKLKYGEELNAIGKEYLSKACKNVYINVDFNDSSFGTTYLYDLNNLYNTHSN